jgi:pimeloyl-ACP methyl ester carboxylesterase
MGDNAVDYDEFAMLKQYADHEGIPWSGRPQVVRRSYDVGSGRQVSAIVWGDDEPEIVLLHGNGQNAHTWDSVAMALNVPSIAIDLPGHGHSDWRDDHDYGAWPNAEAIASVIDQAARRADVVVGMSLGGMTNVSLSANYPALVRRAVFVDITPGSGARRAPLNREQRGATILRDGPVFFDSFDDILLATAAAVPGRPIESLRPGVLHNSRQLEDGRWTWRYDLERPTGGGSPRDRDRLWEELGSIRVPVMLVRGGRSAFVQEDDLSKFRSHQPGARIELVEDAGHSIQSDRPLQLALLINDFILSTS